MLSPRGNQVFQAVQTGLIQTFVEVALERAIPSASSLNLLHQGSKLRSILARDRIFDRDSDWPVIARRSDGEIVRVSQRRVASTMASVAKLIENRYPRANPAKAAIAAAPKVRSRPACDTPVPHTIAQRPCCPAPALSVGNSFARAPTGHHALSSYPNLGSRQRPSHAGKCRAEHQGRQLTDRGQCDQHDPDNRHCHRSHCIGRDLRPKKRKHNHRSCKRPYSHACENKAELGGGKLHFSESDHGQERRDDRDDKGKEHIPEQHNLHALRVTRLHARRVTSVPQRTDEPGRLYLARSPRQYDKSDD